MKHRRLNQLPLMLGCIIVALIAFIMLFPELVTSKSPYTIQTIRYFVENGKLIIEKAPFGPSSKAWLGTDELGRDLWAFIIYGTRLTIGMGLIITVARFIVALPLSILAGTGSTGAKALIKNVGVVFSAIPALFISIIVLRLDFFVGLSKGYSITAFIGVLTVVGWPKLAGLLMERVSTINSQPFITSEIAIGKSKGKIATQNILPHMVPEMIVLFFMEVARTLAMLMQLGIFSVFIGNLRIIKDADYGSVSYFNISFEPEWASLLGSARNSITTSPWVVLFPAIAFMVSVLGFNLLGEGLRNLMQKKGSKVIPFVRSMFSIDYLKSLVRIENKRLGKSQMAICLIIGIIVIRMVTNMSTYPIDTSIIEPIEYEEVVIGTVEAEEVSKLIENKMVELGLKPLHDLGYRIPYDIGRSYRIIQQEMYLEAQSFSSELLAVDDFSLVAGQSLEVFGSVIDLTELDLYALEDYSGYEEQIIMIDTAFYNDLMVQSVIEKFATKGLVKGVLLVRRPDENREAQIISEAEGATVISISQATAQVIREHKNVKVEFKVALELLEDKGHNVLGILEGTDPYVEDEAIVIGLNYNYLEYNQNEVLVMNLAMMETLCKKYNNRRSLIFMFLDGTVSEGYHGIYSMTENFPYSSAKVKVYLDLTHITSVAYETLIFTDKLAPPSRQLAWNMAYYLEGLLSKEVKTIREPKMIMRGGEYFVTEAYSYNRMFWDVGPPTIIVGTEGVGEESSEALMTLILEAVNRNND